MNTLPVTYGYARVSKSDDDSRNLATQLRILTDHGIRIQRELTEQNVAIVAIRENIDTREDSAAAKFFRRSMLAQGAYQLDSASERIKMGQQRARDQGRMVGRPPALTPEQIEQCQCMREECASLRQMGRVMNCSLSTIKRTLDDMATLKAD